MDTNKPLNLHLACGEEYLQNWINIDLFSNKADLKADVRKLPFENNVADKILANHIIEHFHQREGFVVLKEWYRVLKPGGEIIIETPDFLGSCKKFVESSEVNKLALYGHFFATPWLDGQTHLFLYTENQLKWTLEQVGFRNLKRAIANRYIGYQDINLKIIGIK